MKAGIIGGTGKMGKLFAPVFERAGYEMIVSGRSTAVTNADIAETCDLVIVSVPIRDTVRVIGEIAPLLGKDQVLCDFTSLKVAPVAAMLKSKAAGHRAPPDVRADGLVHCTPDHHHVPGADNRDDAFRPQGNLPARGRGLHDHDTGGARPDDGRRPGAHPLCHDLHGRLHPQAGH